MKVFFGDDGPVALERTTDTTNPKDALGSAKLPLGLVPASAIAVASLGFLNGRQKYGAWNWRATPVRASVYLDAARRHLAAWENGEELDAADGVPHLGALLACVAIIVDAGVHGTLVDDRGPASPGYAALVAELTPKVAAIQAWHAERKPRHFTIADSQK